MKTISISNFSNGVQAPRAQVTGGCISSRHFMLESTKLIPYRDMETESLDTGTLANQRLTDVIRYGHVNKDTGVTLDTQIFALGQVSTSNQAPKFYQKSTVNSPSASFQAITSGESADGTVIPGTLIGYKGAMYCLKYKSGTYGSFTGNLVYLVKHIRATSTADIGIVGVYSSTGVVPQMFVHPKDFKLYIGAGFTGSSYDGSTLSNRDFSTDYDITSITWLGNNILLGMFAKDTTNSVVAIWDGSITSSILVDLVTWSNDCLLILENVGDTVIGISGVSVGGSGAGDVGILNTVTVRGYNGGTPQIITEIESIGSLGSRVFPRKAKSNNTLYFPMSAYLNGTQINQVWAVYKTQAGNFVVTPDRKINNDTEISSSSTPFLGLSVIGDWMWSSFGASSTGSLMRTNDTSLYTTTSSWTSLVNPGVETGDRSKKKQLKAISLRCGSPSAAAHTVTLSYSADGGSFNTIYTGASSSVVRVIEEVAQSNSKPFLSAREYIFKIETIGNGEIYELKYGYDILPTLI